MFCDGEHSALSNLCSDRRRQTDCDQDHREDAAILYNRGRVLEAQQRWQEAVEDYERAMTISWGDVGKIARRRDQCLSVLRDYMKCL